MSDFCPKCGATIENDSHFCEKCGFKLDDSTKCPICGSLNESNAEVCGVCGAGLALAESHTSSEIIAITNEIDKPEKASFKVDEDCSKGWRFTLKIVSNWLLFLASIILAVIPSISFAHAYIVGVTSFSGGYIEFAVNGTLAFIDILSRTFEGSGITVLESLFSATSLLALSVFAVVLQIISIVTLITSIIRICKAQTAMLAKKSLVLFALLIISNVLFLVFSTFTVSLALTRATAIALSLSMLLIIGVAIMRFISKRHFVMSSRKRSFECLKQAVILTLNLIAFAIIGSSLVIGRSGMSSIYLMVSGVGSMTEFIEVTLKIFSLGLIAISGIMVAVQPIETIKQTALKLSYAFYASPNEQSMLFSSSPKLPSPITQAVFATIHLVATLAVGIFLDDFSKVLPALFILLCFVASIVATKVCDGLASKKNK